ncbi:MAG: TRAP transporter large permease [Thermodesulfobacteriota bacterium]
MSIALLIGIFLGHYTAFTLGGLAVIFGLTLWGDTNVLYLFGQTINGMMTNFILVAVPLFIFMGCLMERSGIADTLFGSLHIILGGLKGGLAIATIIICVLFAASTGIIAASISTMAVLALPAMMNRHYDPKLSVGTVMSGGCLGILIPPSIMLIIYGVTAGESIGKLYAGAIFPGLILSSLYILYILIICFLRPNLGPPLPSEERIAIPLSKKISSTLVSLVPPIGLIIAALGSIIAGMATPTEAAAVGALGTIIIAAIYKKLTFRVIKESCLITLKTTSMVLWIVAGALCFASVLMGLECGKAVEELMLDLGVNRYVILFIMMAILFILGCIMDWAEIILITVPIFSPIVNALKFDPLWFGIVFCVNLQLSFLTPPFGYALFFMRGLAPPGITIYDIYRSIWPFLILQTIALVIIIIFPQTVLWLPSLLFAK